MYNFDTKCTIKCANLFPGSISFDKSLETQYVTPGVDEYRVKCVATTSNSKLDIKYGWKIDEGDPAQISKKFRTINNFVIFY